MSGGFFGSLFGKKAPAPQAAAPAPPAGSDISAKTRDAIQNLTAKREMVEKRQKLLEARMNNCVQEARQRMARSDKKGAMLCLKKKKLFEGEAQKYEGAIINLDRQIMMLEGASMDAQVLAGYKESASTIKNIHQALDVDNVDEVMDEMEEAMDRQDEVSRAIGREIGAPLSDADLEAEFAAMCEESVEADLMTVPSVPAGGMMMPDAFPAVPTTVPAAAAPAAKARVAVPAGGMDADMAALAAEFS